MDCVPELVQPPPMTVPDAPRSPLAQTNGPEPTSRFVATGSDCAAPRSAGSAVQAGVPRSMHGCRNPLDICCTLVQLVPGVLACDGQSLCGKIETTGR